MKGRVHSTESFGTVDGPGIRYVVFLQGCPMRCLYCHNPDTWDPAGGRLTDAEEIVAEICKNRAFYQKGGLTVSGGEPLLQPEFVRELFTLAHREGIHTCIDTSGVTFSPSAPTALDALLEVTDLVMLDVKQIDPEAHKRLTGHNNQGILAFARHLEQKKIPLWIRHVVVPGYTDDPEGLRRLGREIGRLSNLQALDVLPYHTMGETKYRELGIPYPLAGVPALSKSAAETARGIILEGIREVRTRA